MSQFLYRIQPTRPGMLIEGPTERESDLVSQHFEYLKRLTAEGVMIIAGRTQTADSRTFGIAIFNAEDEAAAQQIVDNDPAIANGVFSAELFPYRIAVIDQRNIRE